MPGFFIQGNAVLFNQKNCRPNIGRDIVYYFSTTHYCLINHNNYILWKNAVRNSGAELEFRK